MQDAEVGGEGFVAGRHPAAGGDVVSDSAQRGLRREASDGKTAMGRIGI